MLNIKIPNSMFKENKSFDYIKFVLKFMSGIKFKWVDVFNGHMSVITSNTKVSLVDKNDRLTITVYQNGKKKLSKDIYKEPYTKPMFIEGPFGKVKVPDNKKRY